MMGLNRKKPATRIRSLIGKRGEVIKVLKNQFYRVDYQGSCWKARSTQPVTLCLDQQVRVVGIDNITLLIEPV